MAIGDKLASACVRFRKKHGASVRRTSRHVAAVILVGLLIETFVFNFNYFATLTNEPIDMSSKIGLLKDDNGRFKLTAEDKTIAFSHVDANVSNIYLDLDCEQPGQLLRFKINYTDDAHKTFFGDTEYTAGVPEVDVSTFSEQSKFINIIASGKIGSLQIELVGEDISYPVKLDTVVLNARHPFDFNVGRLFIVTGALLLVFAFRPRSSLYRIEMVKRPKFTRGVIVATLCIETVMLSAFLFYGSNLVGVATSFYNPGSWDGKSIVNVFETGGDNAQQYAELARSMSKGSLSLEQEPPSWLQQMPDPYDKGARDELQKQTGEKYLFDVAYRGGKYYVYFGVVPVVLFYLPFYLATGASFPTAIGVWLSVLAFVAGCTVLLDRFARVHFKHVTLGLYLLLQIPLVMCSGVLYLLKFPTFYSLPIALGLAFSVWGLYCWMHGRSCKHPHRWYAAGSLCMALVAGCRPQLLVLSFLAFPLFWRVFVTEGRLKTKEGRSEFACLIAPYAIVAAGIMWYNYARFGSVADFGANYNLTVNDMTKRGWIAQRIPPAFFAYFLQPVCVSGVFPFVQAAPFATTYMGQTIKEVTFGGIFACMPVLWAIPFVRRIVKLRSEQRSTRTITGVVAVLLAGGIVVALADAEMAGILQRYFADFSFMFLMVAVLLVFIANENLPRKGTVRVLLTKTLLFAVVVSVLYVVLLCFVPETGWYSDIYPWAYQDLIESAQFWM